MLEPLINLLLSYLTIIKCPFVFLPIIIGNIIILNIIFKNKLLKVSIISIINQGFVIIMVNEILRLSLYNGIPFVLNDININIIRVILILITSIIICLITSLVIRQVSKNQFYYLVLICLVNVFIMYILCDNVIVFLC